MKKDNSKIEIKKAEKKYKFYLVVKCPFLNHLQGDSIHEDSEIEEVLSSTYLQSVLKVSYPPNE